MSRHMKSKNILHSIILSRQYEQRFSVVQKNKAFFEKVDERLHLHGIPKFLAELDYCSTLHDFDAKRCSRIIQDLTELLIERRSPDDGEDFKKHQELSVAINDFRGPEILVRILCYDFSHLKVKPTEEVLQHLYTLALDLLHNVNYYNINVAKTLGLNYVFINRLFMMLKQKETYVYASHLLDDILRTRSNILSLTQVKCLPYLVSQMNDRQLANFCRVLYFILTDADQSCEDRNTLVIQDTNKKFQERAKITDDNQEIILSIPDFLPRICTLASESLDRSSPFPLGSPLASTRLQQLTSLFNGVLDDIADRDDHTSILHSPYFSLSLKFFQDIMLKVEALFILCVLLTGRNKTLVQSQLASLRLIPKLCIFFDELNWTDNSEVLDNEDCHCAQECTLKVQFLRLLHSFSDHHDKKYLLLTPSELRELKVIYEENKLEVPEIVDNYGYHACCEGEQGLLTKTLDVLKSVPDQSPLRFWLSRALEGFLRGKASYADQVFLIKRGLLELLVNHICSKGIKSKEVLQSSFDLLGELMKFNYIAFKQFNNVITDEQFDKFVEVMTCNVIDSNMFMRCLVLSYEHFAVHRDFCGRFASRLTAIVSNCRQRVYLLQKLIMSVSVETLTQENVSCLNTSLVFLMFALNKGYLPYYLKAFRAEEAALSDPGYILDNLRCLLMFWKIHYLGRGKDCGALEQSSCIVIQQWREAVDILLHEDVSNPKAVAHYISRKVDRNS